MPKARKTLGKRVIDPNAPKKPSGAYIHYCQAKRAEAREANPGAGVAAIGKILGEMWRNETIDSKQPYYDLARQDKERYNRAFAAYTINRPTSPTQPAVAAPDAAATSPLQRPQLNNDEVTDEVAPVAASPLE